MKTNYPLTRTNRRSSGKPLLFGAGTALLLIVVLQLWNPSLLWSASAFVSFPVWRGAQAVRELFSNVTGGFHRSATLFAENRLLRETLAEKETLLLERAALVAEIEELKKTLGHLNPSSPVSDRVHAAILAKPPQSPYDTFALDAGSFEGVVERARLFSRDVLVGRVERVGSHASIGRLFSSSGQKMAVMIGTTSITTEAVGRGGGMFVIKLPKDIAVSRGDPIFVSGLRGEVLGYVETIEANATDSFQTIYSRSPANLNTLRFVEIERESP